MRFIGKFDCFFGADKYRDFAAAHAQFFSGKGAIIVDASLAEHPGLSQTVQSLSDSGVETTETKLIELKGEPTYPLLDSLAKWSRSNRFEFLVAIGGGSTLDLAKGLAVLQTNAGSGLEFRGFGKVRNAPCPLLTIPTTAGTGSEVTWTASFIDTTSQLKLGINGPNVFPHASLLEPELLLGTPRSVALSAALDALVHAIEAVSSPMASDFTDPLATRAVHLVMDNLAEALRNPDAVDRWESLQTAAFLAGQAMLNSSGGPASGVSYPIGVRYRVPHGYAGGVLLPRVVEMNVSKGYKGYGRLLGHMPTQSKLDLDFSKEFLEVLSHFYDEVKAPSNFSAWGISQQSDVDLIVEDTLNTRAASLTLNPVPFDHEDLRQLVESTCLAQ